VRVDGLGGSADDAYPNRLPPVAGIPAADCTAWSLDPRGQGGQSIEVNLLVLKDRASTVITKLHTRRRRRRVHHRVGRTSSTATRGVDSRKDAGPHVLRPQTYSNSAALTTRPNDESLQA
jgi:hypothetical protein